MVLGRNGSLVLAVAAVVVALATACGDSDDGSPEDGSPAATTTAPVTSEPATPSSPAGGETSDELYPDVLEATATLGGDGTWSFDVTMSSPYDSAERYADAWRVTGPDGTVFGVRELTHDHAAEQPFTRSLSGVEIPDDVNTVTVEGRDQVSGWGGATVEVALGRG